MAQERETKSTQYEAPAVTDHAQIRAMLHHKHNGGGAS